MFRIKTDIRQYKCETKDKVEKLIRNWVIRPNDLIYDADGRDWAPIGEHPAFMGLFGLLDEQEKNTPDTVVTARSPYAAEEPQDDSDAPDIDGADAHAAADDARVTDVFDQEQIAESLSAPAPPEAPPGVEPLVRDAEVTVMTERTLQMLKITDEDESPAAPAAPAPQALTPVAEDEATPDEVTTLAAQPESAAEGNAEESDHEITGVRERQSGPLDAVADPVAAPAADAEPQPEPPGQPGPPRSLALESGPKLGRHDLPEELFATNEISSPEVQEQIKRLDELAELEPSEPTATKDSADDDSADKSDDWPSRLDEDSGIDEAWDVIAEDLRKTEEIGDQAQPLADTEELERDDFDEEEDGEWGGDTSEPEIIAPADFVSDGYKIPLPFPVRPTADDIRLGMPQGRVSRAVKDRHYPLPEPKKLNVVHHREFELTPKPPADRTALLAAGVVVLVFAIAIAVASC